MSLAQNVTQLGPSCTDHELIVAVRGGNDRAFEELYGRYVARIRAYVHGLVGDHGRAEDVTQDIFIAALRRLRETDRQVVFKPWIYEIARNACIDEFRRRRRAQEVSLESAEGSSEMSERLLSSAPPPEIAVENKQKLDDLRGAFDGLSDTHHRIMVMRELEGLSYGQIGERMGMSRPVVQSTLFRARRRLHAEYDELITGRRCEQVQTMIVAGDERPVRALGTRQRRQLTRHLAHCQPCRRDARMAGVDESFFHAPGLLGKIGALLPFPWLRLRRGPGGGQDVAGSVAHSWSFSRPLQALARLADPSGPLTGFGRAATAAAAAIVVAGAGGGIVAGLESQHQPPHHPLPSRAITASPAAARARQGAANPALPRGATSSARSGASSGAGTKPRRAARRRSAKGSSQPGGGATTQSTTGAASRPSSPTGTGPGVPATVAKPAGGVSSAAGLLRGASSGAPALPKPPAVPLPSVQSVTNAVNHITAPLPPPPGLDSLPKPQLPSVSPPDPSKLLPPLGRASG